MFKLGDKVRIKNDLQNGRTYYGGIIVNKSMVAYLGQESTIIKVFQYKGYNVYNLKDVSTWTWSEEMLEPVFINSSLTDALIEMLSNSIGSANKEPEETDWRKCYANHKEQENKRFGITDRYCNID